MGGWATASHPLHLLSSSILGHFKCRSKVCCPRHSLTAQSAAWHFLSIAGNFCAEWAPFLRELFSLMGENQSLRRVFSAKRTSSRPRTWPGLTPCHSSCSPGHHGFHGNPLTSNRNEGDWRGGGRARRLEGRRESESWINPTLLALSLHAWPSNHQVPDST